MHEVWDARSGVVRVVGGLGHVGVPVRWGVRGTWVGEVDTPGVVGGMRVWRVGRGYMQVGTPSSGGEGLVGTQLVRRPLRGALASAGCSGLRGPRWSGEDSAEPSKRGTRECGSSE